MADISPPSALSDPANLGVSNDPTPPDANNESTKRSDVHTSAFHKRHRPSQCNRYLTYIDLPDYIFKPFDIRHRNPSTIFDNLIPRQNFKSLSRCRFIDILVHNIPADANPTVIYHRFVTAAFVACDTNPTLFGKGDGTHPNLDCDCPTSRARMALLILRKMPTNARQCKNHEIDFMYYDWVLLHLFITKHARVGHPYSPREGIDDHLASFHIDSIHEVLTWLDDCSEQYDRSFDKITEATWHTPYKPSFFIANRKRVPYYENDKHIFGSIEAPTDYQLSPSTSMTDYKCRIRMLMIRFSTHHFCGVSMTWRWFSFWRGYLHHCFPIGVTP